MSRLDGRRNAFLGGDRRSAETRNGGRAGGAAGVANLTEEKEVHVLQRRDIAQKKS